MAIIYKLQDVSLNIKKQIVDYFNSEWGEGIYTVQMLENTWMRKKEDVMLVMIDENTSQLIGTIGLDHKYFLPIASHLYVAKQFRQKGYADILISEIEKQTNKKMYAWCKPEKVSGNERRGWVKERFLGFSRLCPLVPMSKMGCKIV